MTDDSAENIEARLGAYVDGELDAAQRAQIERHLQSNPKDRALLQELMRLRADVGALPRASAPDDLADALQAQLERSALLGQDASKDGGAMRIARWSHLALAAMLLLAAGLAVVLWAVLSRPAPTRVAVLPAPPLAASRPSPPPAESPLAAADGETSVKPVGPATTPSAPEVTGGTLAVATPATQPADETRRGAVANADDLGEPAQKQLRDEQQAKGVGSQLPAYRLVVNTDNASAAVTQVAQFLADNRIDYRPAADRLAQAQTIVSNAAGPLQQAVQNQQAAAAPAAAPAAPPPTAERAPAPPTFDKASAPESGRAAVRPAPGPESYACRMTFRQAAQLADALSQSPHQSAQLLPVANKLLDLYSGSKRQAAATAPSSAPEEVIDAVIVFQPAAPATQENITGKN